MKSCFGYVRVSTVKQGDGVSLEAQREAIAAFAERNELTISKWFEEKETAAKRGRPIFNKMIGELMKGKATGLIVHKIDRSARNFTDWAKIGDLADAGVNIHFANENLDFKSRGGRLTADIQAVIAADYIRNLREETIKGINGRLKQGLYPFGAPTGYLDAGGGKPKTVDPVRGPLIRTLFELYATGEYPLWSLVREMKARGLRSRAGQALSKSSIDHILRNPFYVGVIRIKRTGHTFPGAHEPLITPELFERVAAVRAGRHIKKVTKHNLRYRGLFRCGHCARTIIPERQKGHVYYRCQTLACPTTTVREEVIEAAMNTLLRRFMLTETQIHVLRQHFVEWLAAHDDGVAAADIQFELTKLDERLSRLTDKLLDNVIDDATFQHKKQELLMEQQRLKSLGARKQERAAHLARFEKFLELAKSLYSSYIIAAATQKREIVKWATSNRLIVGKNVCVEPSKWLTAIEYPQHFLSGAPDSDTSRTVVRDTAWDDADFEALLELEIPPIDSLNEGDIRDAA